MPVTMRDVAVRAGVSLATVGRALHGRGVRPATAEKVQAAIEELDYKPNIYAVRLNRRGRRKFLVYLPETPTLFINMLADEVAEKAHEMQRLGIDVKIKKIEETRYDEIANEVRDTIQDVDGIALVAPANPAIVEAINDVSAAGIPVVTLVTDQPGSKRLAFSGVDNLAAGRAGGDLLGRILGDRSGDVLCVTPTLQIQAQIERLAGFQQVFADFHPDHSVVVLRCPDHAPDDPRTPISPEQAGVYIQGVLDGMESVAAVFSTGGNTRAVAAALTSSQLLPRPLFVGYDLTPASRRLLADGGMDAVIEQSPRQQVTNALNMLVSLSDKETLTPDAGMVSVQIIMRFNLPPVRQAWATDFTGSGGRSRPVKISGSGMHDVSMAIQGRNA